MLAPYLAFASASLKRQFSYRLANWAGLFTNAFFLFFRVAVLSACFEGRGITAGMSVEQALSYAAFTQALLMVAPFWGVVGVGEAVLTGQVAVELSRPVNFLGMMLSKQLGLSVYYLVVRGMPMLILGAALGFLAPPASLASLPLLVLALFLGAVVAHLFLILAELSSFWLESDRGMKYLTYSLTALLGGLLLPLSFFPDALQPLLHALPFRSALYFPAEIYLGLIEGSALAEGLALQLTWVLLLWMTAQGLLECGRRKLVIHGG